MEHIDIQTLKRVAQEAPQHLPLLWAVYSRPIAEDIADRKLTQKDWSKIYDKFLRESDTLWTALYELFSQVVYEVVDLDDE